MKYKILKNDHIDFQHPTTHKPVRLYRIVALKSFDTRAGRVEEGSIGGYIGGEVNLSQNDFSWVFSLSKIFDDALLVDSVLVDNAAAYENAIIQDSILKGYSVAKGKSTVVESVVGGNVTIDNGARIRNCNAAGSVIVRGSADVLDSELSGGVLIEGAAHVIKCKLHDTTHVCGSVTKITNCHFSGHTFVKDAIINNETWRHDADLQINQQTI